MERTLTFLLSCPCFFFLTSSTSFSSRYLHLIVFLSRVQKAFFASIAESVKRKFLVLLLRLMIMTGALALVGCCMPSLFSVFFFLALFRRCYWHLLNYLLVSYVRLSVTSILLYSHNTLCCFLMSGYAFNVSWWVGTSRSLLCTYHLVAVGEEVDFVN